MYRRMVPPAVMHEVPHREGLSATPLDESFQEDPCLSSTPLSALLVEASCGTRIVPIKTHRRE